MSRWEVRIDRYSLYAVEAETEDQAIDLALSGEVEESGGETTGAVAFAEAGGDT